jgi:Protein tyrosine and serine/threonine kinase
MLDASRVWPSPDAYQNAVLSPRRFLRDARLHAAHVESRFFLGSQRPNLRSGNFGAVYRFKGPQRSYALKVFYKADTERQQRYQLIDQHLAGQAPSTHLVSFRYDEEGIQVHRRWYPTLVMDWAPGKTLDLYLQECRGEIRNGLFCQSFAHMVRELQDRRMAHGDLQHGNILVQAAGQLKLVDYDGMFVPGMTRLGMEATESGLPAYQHPSRARRPDYFDARLDDFAALVLLLTLAAMTPERWRRHHGDDNYLLFSKEALHLPKRSVLFHELAASPEVPIRRLANLLKLAAVGPIDSIPSFAQVAADPAIREILSPSWKPGQPPPARVQPKVLRGGPWWQNQAAKKPAVSPPPAPQRSVAPARATPFPAILQLRRTPPSRPIAPKARVASPATKPPIPPKKPASQGSRVPALRLLQTSPAPQPRPRTSWRWRRWLFFLALLGLTGFFATALNWPRHPFERTKPADADPVRVEGRQR